MLVRTAIVLILLTAPAFSGGWFIITLGQPSAHSDLRAHSAFVVRVYGCSALAAHVSATAEGLVNGSRQSVPLTPIPVSGGRSSVVFSGDTRFVEEWPSFSVAIPREW